MSMQWKKLADEKPTEEGFYMLIDSSFENIEIRRVYAFYSLRDLIDIMETLNLTHWLLIQPPKGEQK